MLWGQIIPRPRIATAITTNQWTSSRWRYFFPSVKDMTRNCQVYFITYSQLGRKYDLAWPVWVKLTRVSQPVISTAPRIQSLTYACPTVPSRSLTRTKSPLDNTWLTCSRIVDAMDGWIRTYPDYWIPWH